MPIKPLTSAMTTRRQALKRALCASTVLVAAPGGFSRVQAQGAAAAPAAPTGPFKLPPLPYAYDALEPHIDAQTMQIHHDKHHATYVANLNKAVADNAALAARSVEDLVRNLNTVPGPVRDAVRNNAGGHLNHEFFWNLLKNASKFTPSGGNIAIRSRNEPGWAIVEVVDSGVGIEADALPNIFVAFQQADTSITRRFGGLGLGLAIATATVEAQGGTIVAASAGAGQGATFTVKLPLSTPEGQHE